MQSAPSRTECRISSIDSSAVDASPLFDHILGDSPAIQAIESLVEKVSQCRYPVLLLGETGTGKELVARLIHSLGPRRLKPFVPVDCASVTPTLIESELFGHTKGAFTGATEVKHGLFEAANEGTLFLDEIGELPPELQSKLLRAMQEKMVRRVGSIQYIPINFRVIAATNRDLDAELKNGGFRQDLYFRLNVVEIKLPPLRERKTDIPFLVAKFLEKYRDSRGLLRSISDGGLRRLFTYDWPGNVRELENAIERAVALTTNDVLLADDFSFGSSDTLVAPQTGSHEIIPLEEMERRAIFRTLKETDGDRIAAARLLGIGKTTLYRKLVQYAKDSLTVEHP
jgi:two-component system response regulator HydG